MSPKVIVTGATGLLGREIVRAFEVANWTVIGTGFSRARPPSVVKLDLADHNAVQKLLADEAPQVIVHSAANRFPDKCDADPDGARALNVEATRNLVREADKVGSLVIYISTDYVFPGRPGEAPYEVDAKPEPTNLYGQTKLDGERVTLLETQDSGRGVVLRVPVLYGPAETPAESAINVLMETLQKAQTAEADIAMDDWAQRYPTHTADVGRVCQEVAGRFLALGSDRLTFPKILQFSSEDRMTKYQVCELMAAVSGLSMAHIAPNRTGNDQKAKVQRPFDTHLSSRALRDLSISLVTHDFRAWWQAQVDARRS